jgi:thiol reductant ABC exporter CydC subunit
MSVSSNSVRAATLRALLFPVGLERKRAGQAVAAGLVGQLSAVGLLACSAWLIAAAALRPPVLTLTVAIAAVQAFALMRGAARYGERLASHDLALRVLARVRVFAFEHLEPLVPGRLPGVHRGDLLNRFVTDVDGIQDLYVRALVPLLGALASSAITVLVAVLLDPAAGLVLGVGLGIGAVVLPLGMAALGARSGADLARSRGLRDAIVVESLHGASEVAVFGAQAAVLGRLRSAEREVLRQARHASIASGAGQSLGVALGGVLAAATVAASLSALDAGRISGVVVVVLGFLALASANGVADLPEAFATLTGRLRGAGRVHQMTAQPAVPKAQVALLQPATDALSFALKGASVGYDPARPPALDGVDLEIGVGCHLAVVGRTGAGKTTLSHLLLGFVEPNRGQVEVDGVDLRRWDAEAIRGLIAWAPQDPHVFHTTVAANLRLARPEASDAELAAVLAQVGLAPWIARLPDGLAATLGERGETLSGGERQRLGVARALLSGRPILLLDEPTAHLDATAEAELREAVLAAAAGKTLVWITHRHLGLDAFDVVVTLDHGRVASSLGAAGPAAAGRSR